MVGFTDFEIFNVDIVESVVTWWMFRLQFSETKMLTIIYGNQ